ncbi:tyrosine-type recombinase/integrase [Pseudoalteromonas sp. SG43-1]|uniref:tyrosine-type recombinase/integrase n=1 Tax=Pseudoalteromonas TaxID=53246 RepID=UPI001601A3E2|nr:site-specific integrase [Pseudoalteromonas sp. SG43-1]MBB1453258.1 tyrosine-type recombinase/integrase [Pseudoalteromonas sp. SG43-1]|tara:strand:- start:1300 stop:2550 length:1251 start_codon:yes stop_codon:yes gene_type:complete
MNVKEIKAKIKNSTTLRFSVSDGLYIKPNKDKKSGAWELRYTMNKKRHFMTLKGSNFPDRTLSDARIEAALINQKIKNGVDPLAERVRQGQETIITMNDLFNDWFKDKSKEIESSHLLERQYNKDIKPYIGKLKIDDVNARDIRAIIKNIANDGRPSISSKCLHLCKNLFKHAHTLDLTKSNPAAAFSQKDAGGQSKSRDRVLSLQEIETTFDVLRENSTIFTRDNYLAMVLLLIFGNRKTELTQAKWDEFDFKEKVWNLGKRNKKKKYIQIPIADEVIPVFEELKVKSCGSEYVFPARKVSKKGHMCENTLNHALAKMFGKSVSKKSYPDLLEPRGIKHFTIHDLRRTCRSLLAELGYEGNEVTRYLNHTITGVAGIYNRYDYLDERRKLASIMANQILPRAKISMVSKGNNLSE